MPPGILRRDLNLAYVHSQMNPQTCTKFGANQSSCLTASPNFRMCDPLKPPGVLRGELYLAYIHSKTNPKICTKFGSNRSIRLTASPHIWICDPLKTRNDPGVLWGELYLAYVHSQTNPPTCTKFGANRCNRLTASQDFWICDPLPPTNAPWGIEGRLGFSLCPFPDESADVNQSRCQSVLPFDSFPRLLNVWPLTPPPKCPLVSRGAICLEYIHSQMDLQMCAKFGANRSSRLTTSQDFWICDTLTPPPHKCPLWYWVATCI